MNSKFQTTFRATTGARRSSAIAAAVILATAGQAGAIIPDVGNNTFTNPGAGAWSDPLNWSFGTVPGFTDNVIYNQGTPTIAAADAARAGLLELNGSAGLQMTGGSLQTASHLRVGNVAGDNVSFTQSGGDTRIISRGGGFWIGNAGTGTYTLSGGSTTIGEPYFWGSDFGTLIIGNGAGGNGTLNINGGTLTNYALVLVSRQTGQGTVNMSGGTWNMGMGFGHGTTNRKVTFNHSGGEINVGTRVAFPRSPSATDHGSFVLGLNTTDRSTYTMSGSAVLNTAAHLYIGGGAGPNAYPIAGNWGHGDFIMNGGTINVGSPNNPNYGNVYIGNAQGGTNASGTLTLNDASATVNVAGGVVVGQKQTSQNGIGTGTVTVNAGQLLLPKGDLTIGRVNTISANGTVNLKGGRIQANSLSMVKSATGTPIQEFNWTGGDLEINRATMSYMLTNNGGTLRPGVTAPGAFTLIGTEGSYTQTAAGTLALDVASESSYDSINASGGDVGAINLAGTVNATLSAGFAPGFGSTFAVLSGKSINDTASWNLPAAPAGQAWDHRVVTEGANQIKLISIAPASSTALPAGSWTGPGAVGASYVLEGAGGSVSVDAPVTAGYLQVGGTGNWNIDGANTLTFSAASGRAGLLAYGNTTTVNAPISFAGDGAIGAATAGTTVTVNGAVSGSGTITKTGSGTLALTSATSSFAGTWALSGGAVNINGDENFGAAGASLRVEGAAISAVNGWNSARAIELRGAGLNVIADLDSSLSGAISGSGGLSKSGGAKLTLSGANTYAGPTVVNGGILETGGAGAIPTGSAVVLASGSTLNLAGNAQTIGSLAVSGASPATVTTGGANLTVGGDDTSTLFRGNINGGGAGVFTKTGSGILQISGVAAPAGSLDPEFALNVQQIVVDEGILQVNALARNLLALPFSDITVNEGAMLSLSGTGTAGGYVLSAINGAGGLSFHGGTTELAADSTYTGPTEIRASNVTLGTMGGLGSPNSPVYLKPVHSNLGNGSIIRFTLDGTFSKPIVVEAPASLNLHADTFSVSLDKPISGPGQVNFQSGTFTLLAKNTNQGPTQLAAGMTVKLGVADAISSNRFTVAHGTLDLNGHDQTLGALVGNNTAKLFISGGNTLTLGADNLDTANTAAGQTAYRGVISGAGALTKIGGGLQHFVPVDNSAFGAFTGPIHVKGGALRWDGDSRMLNTASGITVDTGTAMIVSFTTAESGATTPVLDLTISGGGAFQKNSNDDLELTATNSYAGGTRIRGGYLIVSSDAALGAAPAALSPKNLAIAGTGGIQLKTQFDLHPNRGIELASGSTARFNTNGFNSTMGGPIAGAGGFTKTGDGTLTIKSLNAGGPLAVQGGVLAVSSQTPRTTIKAASVSVAAGTRLDLASNNLIVSGAGLTGTWTGTAYDGTTGLVAAGRNGGLWNGDGIVTTAATAGSNLTTLGVALADDLGKVGSTFGGHTIAAGETIVMYTYGGDANLDGKVNIDDYGRIDSNVSQSGVVFGWYNGDFNYDGKINIDDYGIIDSNVNGQGAPFPTGGSAMGVAASDGVSAVPEPGSLGLLAAGTLAGLSRRRRRN